MKRGPTQDAQLYQRIGYRIFKERERRRLTALVLARRAGIHKNTVYRAEQGLGISVRALLHIAAAMEIGLDELLAFSQHVVTFSERPEKAAKVECGTEKLFEIPDPAPAGLASTPAMRAVVQVSRSASQSRDWKQSEH